jgi:hypothetical protein
VEINIAATKLARKTIMIEEVGKKDRDSNILPIPACFIEKTNSIKPKDNETM